MNSESSERKEKRVQNLKVETVGSPLGPNLFMYAGSFWQETILVFIVLHVERNYSLSWFC